MPAKSELVQEITDLARSRPSLFQAIIGNSIHFWPKGSEPESEPGLQLTPDLIKQGLTNDDERSKRDHSFRTQIVRAVVFVTLAFLVFSAVLVWLMREHIEFTKQVLYVVVLLVSHGAAGAGGYQIGKKRPPRPRR